MVHAFSFRTLHGSNQKSNIVLEATLENDYFSRGQMDVEAYVDANLGEPHY